MNTYFKPARLGLIALSALLVCGLAQAQEMTFEVAPPETSATTGQRLRVSMKYNAVEQTSTVEFVNVPELDATVTDVEVLLVYRDASGAVVSTTPGIFENGCQVARTRDGVDAICEVAGRE